MKLIKLTRGLEAKVDDADYDALSPHKWHAHFNKARTRAYAARSANSDKQTVYLHRQILGLSPDDPRQGDHVDGDSLNNQRYNLRVVTAAQNRANRRRYRPKFIGVFQHRQKFRAVIEQSGTTRRLGVFVDPAEAARAYDKEALKLRGEFAVLNFPEHGSQTQTTVE